MSAGDIADKFNIANRLFLIISTCFDKPTWSRRKKTVNLLFTRLILLF